jgi:rubredoxin
MSFHNRLGEEWLGSESFGAEHCEHDWEQLDDSWEWLYNEGESSGAEWRMSVVCRSCGVSGSAGASASIEVGGWTCASCGHEWDEISGEPCQCDAGTTGYYAESFAAPLTFNQWSDDEKHESSHQGGDTYFEDWVDEEIHAHGKGISLKRWGDEEESEGEHQHAESKPYSPMLIGAFIGLGTGLWAMKQIHDRKYA